MDYTSPSSFGSCYMRRRNSDVFSERRLSRHSCLSEGDNSEDDDNDDASSCVSALSLHGDIVGRNDSDCATTAANGAQHACKSGMSVEHEQSSLRARKRRHLLLRSHTTFAHIHYRKAKSETVTNYSNDRPPQRQTDIHETIKDNTQEEPMSSAQALHLLNTVLSSASSPLDHQTAIERQKLVPMHDASCKHCISEAMAATHKAATKGVVWHGGQSELRMNLGNGRNAIYVAPCERHLECPLDKVGKYLIHTNKSKIMTDMSKVEFGICVDGWNRVVFKTVNDPELSARELYFHHKIATCRSEHLVRLLDEFTDTADKHVMVFPRMNSAEIYGHDLFDIAYIARQLFTALEELHSLGIAHLDITPTNLMSDPNDPSHVEVIDFGLACDISNADDGYLPSRGTCGFVAPEVLSGNSNDLRADIYSAGVVLGMMLQKYLPTVNLRLLGGPLVRSDTTDALISQIDELLEAYKYAPEAASFVDCNTTFTQPLSIGATVVGAAATDALAEAHMTDSTVYGKETSNRGSRCYFDTSDDEAAACAAAYMGGGSMFGGYGNFSGDEDDAYPASNSKTGTGTSNTYNSRSNSNSGNNSRPNGTKVASNPLFCQSNTSEVALEHFGQRLDAFAYSEQKHFCTASPNNTPVYARSLNEAASSSTRGSSNIHDILESSLCTSSNVRYAATLPAVHASARNLGSSALQTYTSVAIRTTSSTQSNSSSSSNNENGTNDYVKKPGKVPEAVLHAADLLRWTLQTTPQCRPTATQALEHPFLASIAIKRKRQHTVLTSSPTTSIQYDTSDFAIANSDQHSRKLQHSLGSGKLEPKSGTTFLAHGGRSSRSTAMHKAKRSDSGIATEINSNTDSHMCDEACGSSTESRDSADCNDGSRSSSAETAAQREQGMFKNAAMDNIHIWEKEMYSRLATHGERSMDYESPYSSSSYGHTRDEISSFYTSNCNDITSYFY
ncbi:hypothetical protein GGI23_000724 [Coemansia sp. RSA 2559]|nr:hypothetical protein GGI23_000724 [Coemansia sp. RSA 2559]